MYVTQYLRSALGAQSSGTEYTHTAVQQSLQPPLVPLIYPQSVSTHQILTPPTPPRSLTGTILLSHSAIVTHYHFHIIFWLCCQTKAWRKRIIIFNFLIPIKHFYSLITTAHRKSRPDCETKPVPCEEVDLCLRTRSRSQKRRKLRGKTEQQW